MASNLQGGFTWTVSLQVGEVSPLDEMIAKNLAPYRIGKRPHKQNRAKIPPKYRKSYSFSIFDVFLGYFEGCCLFLSCRGPSLSQ